LEEEAELVCEACLSIEPGLARLRFTPVIGAGADDCVVVLDGKDSAAMLVLAAAFGSDLLFN